MFSTYLSEKLGLGSALTPRGWVARWGCGETAVWGLPFLPLPDRMGTAWVCPEPPENQATWVLLLIPSGTGSQ